MVARVQLAIWPSKIIGQLGPLGCLAAINIVVECAVAWQAELARGRAPGAYDVLCLVVISAVYSAAGAAWLDTLWRERGSSGNVVRGALLRLAHFVAAALTLALGLALALSWAMRATIGRYAVYDDLALLAQNYDSGLWGHLAVGEQFGVVAVSGCYALAVLAARRWARSSHQPFAGAPRERRKIKVALWALVAAISGSLRPTLPISAYALTPTSALVASFHRRQTNHETAYLTLIGLAPIQRESGILPSANRPNVILIQVESMRSDILASECGGKVVVPVLRDLAEESLVFRRAYSPSTHTSYSEPAIFSSLLPLRTLDLFTYQASDPFPKTLIYDKLKPLGYRTAIFSSDTEAWGGMADFIRTDNLDFFEDAESRDVLFPIDERDLGAAAAVRSGLLRGGPAPDSSTFADARAWIKEARGKPFFLSIITQDSHFPYDPPGGHPDLCLPSGLSETDSFIRYPEAHLPLARNTYWNALSATDHYIGELLDDLRQSGELGNTILAVMGDHGEAFGEHKGVTHGGLPFEEQVHVALLLRMPDALGLRGEVEYPVGLTDVVPTILAQLGFPASSAFQGQDMLGEQPPVDSRMLFFHVNSVAHASGLLWGTRWKYFETPDQNFLFDLQADPGEQENLVQINRLVAVGLHQMLVTWVLRQLSYYHDPNTYTKYYPPPVPQVPDELRAIYRD